MASAVEPSIREQFKAWIGRALRLGQLQCGGLEFLHIGMASAESVTLKKGGARLDMAYRWHAKTPHISKCLYDFEEEIGRNSFKINGMKCSVDCWRLF